jgi:formylglycine-generating enzyme
MKLTSLLILTAVILSLSSFVYCFSKPVVSNVNAYQTTDGSLQVMINYDLYDADGDACYIYLSISDDNGISYNINPTFDSLSGDLQNVYPGTSKLIIWNASMSGLSLDGSNFRFKIVADDLTWPPSVEGMAFVEGGTFNNGSSDVTLTSFYIDVTEVTQFKFSYYMGYNPASGSGVGNQYPVYNVTFFNAVEYCNRLSIALGLTPCYSYSTFGTNPDNWPAGWNTDANNGINIVCDWDANGHRLPTEMEWMYATRGGMNHQGYIYAGAPVLSSVGWYSANATSTMPVGTKQYNEVYTKDMSGNVLEWCWDGMGSYPTFPTTDPHYDSGNYNRVIRGGSWFRPDYMCTVSYRDHAAPLTATNQIGFRTVRKLQ